MNKKGIAPIIWGIVVAAGLIGGGLIANAFKKPPEPNPVDVAFASTFTSIPPAGWIIIIIMIFYLVYRSRK